MFMDKKVDFSNIVVIIGVMGFVALLIAEVLLIKTPFAPIPYSDFHKLLVAPEPCARLQAWRCFLRPTRQ
jgi:hypothetical protein